jgi:hypothetical protein
MSLKVGPCAGSHQRFDRKLLNGLAVAGLAAALGACAVDLNLSELNPATKLGNITNNITTSTLAFQGGRDFSLRPITQQDLVGPEGQCSGGASPSMSTTDADGQSGAAPALMTSGIALQMTECEVVQRAGGPDGIEFGNEGGERSVVLTYTHGARPGIYRFSGGRLYSIERAPEPAGAAKPQKKSPPAKKRAPA